MASTVEKLLEMEDCARRRKALREAAKWARSRGDYRHYQECLTEARTLAHKCQRMLEELTAATWKGPKPLKQR